MKLLIALITLTFIGCNSPKIIKHIGDENQSLFGGVYEDGGSLALSLTTTEDKVVVLVLDKSMKSKSYPKEKGHLYWGNDNFNKHIKLDYSSDLAAELLEVLKEARKKSDDDFESEFLDGYIQKLEQERRKL